MTSLSANELASVIVARSGSYLTAMQLQKLLYYVQAWHVAVTDEPLFPEKFKAWADGPVIPQVWHARKEPSSRSVSGAGDLPSLDDLSSDIVTLVLAAYGSMSGDELSALTHTEQPWCEAREGVQEGEHSSSPISLQTMASFFRANRKLGGRSAADLAAGGVHIRASGTTVEPLDIDAFLASLGDEFNEVGGDAFGGANLALDESDNKDGIETEARRSYQGA